MQIKKFRAENIKTALEKVKKEFGTDAVILSAKNTRNGKTSLFNKSNEQVEITAAVDYNERAFGPAYAPVSYEKDFSKKSAQHPFQHPLPYTNYQGPVQKRPEGESQRFRKNDTLVKLAMVHDHMIKHHIDHDSSLQIIRELWQMYRSEESFDQDKLPINIAKVLYDFGVSEKLIKLKKGKRRIVAFVGKSGVGKTTSAIKVAALAGKYLNSTKIGLISIIDQHRGDFQKAQGFAKIIGYEHKVVFNAIEFKQAVAALRDKNLILIDTPSLIPSHSHLDEPLCNYLTQFYPMEIHMVVSANDKIAFDSSLESDHYPLPISHLLFSKLDETPTLGNIISMLMKQAIPLSYFSWGPIIPENIEKGNIAKIVEVILKEADFNRNIKGDPESVANMIHEFELMLGETKRQISIDITAEQESARRSVQLEHRLVSNY